MFDLDQAIKEWRKQMLAAEIKSADVLNELESHLRDEVNTLCASGLPQAQAFETAVKHLGNPIAMQLEFKKVQPAQWLPVTIASFAWLTLILLFLARELFTAVFTGRMGFLLFSHILTLTTGYCAAFMAGCFGIAYVCRRQFQNFSQSRRLSLNRAIILFTRVSAMLIVIGYLLGMIWSKLNRGTFFTGSEREIGPMLALIWIAMEIGFQKSLRANMQITALLAIAGNIVVCLAWFGMLIVVSRSYEFANHIPLASFIAVHCIFLVIAALPERSTLVPE